MVIDQDAEAMRRQKEKEKGTRSKYKQLQEF